jgi:hypothetical protein
MTEERWKEVTDGEYLKFDRIPESERLSSFKDICAFLYLERKFGPSPNNSDMVSYAQHDIFYLCYTYEQLEELTDEDAIFLSRCGCDSCDDSLAFFT